MVLGLGVKVGVWVGVAVRVGRGVGVWEGGGFVGDDVLVGDGDIGVNDRTTIVAGSDKRGDLTRLLA